MKTTILILCIILLSNILYAQEEVKRKDGRTIIINDNGTWKYKQKIKKSTPDTKVMKMIFKAYEEGDNMYLIFNDTETGEEYIFQNPDESKFNGIKILIEDKNAEFDVKANPKYLNKKFIVEALYKTVLASGPGGETMETKTWVITDLKVAE